MKRAASVGVVREWHDEEGWGVVDSAETPGGCWAHFSAVQAEGYRRLDAGQHVHLDWERCEQDGFAYRAVRAWPVDGGAEHPPTSAEGPAGDGYRSRLHLRRFGRRHR